MGGNLSGFFHQAAKIWNGTHINRADLPPQSAGGAADQAVIGAYVEKCFRLLLGQFQKSDQAPILGEVKIPFQIVESPFRILSVGQRRSVNNQTSFVRE